MSATNNPLAQLLLLCSLCFFWVGLSTASGQENNLLNRKISIDFKEMPIRAALKSIAEKGHFSLSYNPDLVDENLKINLVYQNRTVNEVMLNVLGTDFRFKVSGNYLILLKAKKPKEELLGYIRDPKSGKGLANVSLYDKKSLRSAVTDEEGFYRLSVRDSSQIVVSRIGYRDTIFQLQPEMVRFQQVNLVLQAPSATDIRIRAFNKRVDLLAWTIGARVDSIQFWHFNNIPDTIHRPFQLSFLPYVGTNHKLSKQVSNRFSVNVLGGVSAGVNGVELAGVFNTTTRSVTGLQAAGAVNDNRGNTEGAQLAGLYNVTADTLSGLQAAGVFNFCGAQQAHSTQLAGVLNKSGTSDVPMNQAAGVCNFASNIDIFQLAGCFNKAQKVRGLQAAGVVNLAQEVSGAQVSPVNKTKLLKGIQIGLINSSVENRGLQIGLINRSGRRILPIINW